MATIEVNNTAVKIVEYDSDDETSYTKTFSKVQDSVTANQINNLLDSYGYLTYAQTTKKQKVVTYDVQE